MRFLYRLLLNGAALLAIAYTVPNIHVSSYWWAVIVALVLGVVNAVLGTVLKLLALPITVLTLGLFTLVINAFLFWLTAYFLDGFDVNTVQAAFIGSLLMTIASSLVHYLLKD